MYTLKVNITKELIERSSMCGFWSDGTKDDDYLQGYISEHCLFALAFRDIFPNAWIDDERIFPFGWRRGDVIIPNPDEVINLIYDFDKMTPGERIKNIPEQEIEIPIPDEVINLLDISELVPLLQNHPTLKLKEV